MDSHCAAEDVPLFCFWHFSRGQAGGRERKRLPCTTFSAPMNPLAEVALLRRVLQPVDDGLPAGEAILEYYGMTEPA